MKKLILILLVLALALAVAYATDAGKSGTVNGWVTDAKCGVKGAHAGGEACAKKCIDAGEKMVLVTDGDHTVLTVSNPDALKDHIGHHIAVTGHVDAAAKTVHVESAKMLEQK